MPSAMDSKTLVLSTLFLLLSAFTVRSGVVPSLPRSESLQTYGLRDLLRAYGLPVGLFPSPYTQYSLTAFGELTVDVYPCVIELPSSHMLRYEKTCGGKISQRKLENVKGIYLLRGSTGWAPVAEMVLDNVRPIIRVQLDLPERPSVSIPAADFFSITQCSHRPPPSPPPTPTPTPTPVKESFAVAEE